MNTVSQELVEGNPLSELPLNNSTHGANTVRRDTGVKESKGVSATVYVDAQNIDDSDGHYLDSSGDESRAMILHSHGNELR